MKQMFKNRFTATSINVSFSHLVPDLSENWWQKCCCRVIDFQLIIADFICHLTRWRWIQIDLLRFISHTFLRLREYHSIIPLTWNQFEVNKVFRRIFRKRSTNVYTIKLAVITLYARLARREKRKYIAFSIKDCIIRVW